MKKNFNLLLYLFLLFGATVNAQQLRFHKDGTFKIAQFTDTHIISNNPESLVAIKLINEVLDKENPDLVVFTGDAVTGKPAREGWEMVLRPIIERGVPFFVTLGNHDAEQDLTRKEIAHIVVSKPNNLNKLKNKLLADVVLKVTSSKSDKVASLIYCMDSNDYSKVDTVKGYGWFSHNQIGWYRDQSLKYTTQNKGERLPALAFFHIPLPEYQFAFDKNKDIVGERREAECCPKINSGMFASMVERGDVMGVFVGHDHDNDYLTSLYGVVLGYGRFSGGKTIYTHIQNGSRIINLKEGERTFTTYVRLLDGQKIDETNYPNDLK